MDTLKSAGQPNTASRSYYASAREAVINYSSIGLFAASHYIRLGDDLSCDGTRVEIWGKPGEHGQRVRVKLSPQRGWYVEGNAYPV